MTDKPAIMIPIELTMREETLMLFSKNIPPKCAYCKKGKPVDGETILCKKRGVTLPEDACTGFRYDPLKRVPPRPVTPNFSLLKDEDFSL